MVTVLISMKPTLSPLLVRKMYEIVSREVSILLEEGEHVIHIVEALPSSLPRKALHHVRAKILQDHRQFVADSFIPGFAKTEKGYVIFFDADICQADEGLFLELVRTCRNSPAYSVVAPVVLLESFSGCRSDRWYDTAGFIHDGKRATLATPWFPKSAYEDSGVRLPGIYEHWEFKPDTVVELDGSVGCVYCVHAPLLRKSPFLGDFDKQYTEHWPLCQCSRKHGGRLLVRMDLTVHHAYLPRYGEDFH